MSRAFAAGCFFALLGCGRPELPPENPNLVTWRSLLEAAANMEAVPFGAARLFSSASGPVSLTGFASETYGDLDHGNFLAVRAVDNGVEATLAEVSGTGAITWIWSANPAGTLVLEVDGVETEISFAAFLKGGWLSPRAPFAAKTAEGFNLHFPILHQRHCKVSVRAKTRAELGRLFYQIAWNALDGEVEPFDFDTARTRGAALKRLSKRWASPPIDHAEPTFAGVIPAGVSIDARVVDGEGALRSLKISASSKKELADLWIGLFWDGAEKPALRAPLHALCGVSKAFEDVNSIPVMVDGPTATIRWPMPFSNGARVRLENLGERSATTTVACFVDRDASSLERFHGRFAERRNIDVGEGAVLELAEVAGAGRFVGCALQVDNRSGGWWGEGDPLIWLDDRARPAWRGTGSEDYFGFAWCSRSTFEHPTRGQPRPGVMFRYHLIDALPFNEWARFEFEARGVGEGLMDYSTLALWYSEAPSRND